VCRPLQSIEIGNQNTQVEEAGRVTWRAGCCSCLQPFLSSYFATGNTAMRPRALALVSFLAAALLCLCAAAVVAAASPVSVAGKLAVEGQCASGFTAQSTSSV
jgi:hypothetical protein